MNLKKLIKQAKEISKKDGRDSAEYFSLIRDLNWLSPEEKRAIISEIQQDNFLNVELPDTIDIVKNLVARLTGTKPEEVKLEKFMRIRITDIEYIKTELDKTMEDDFYLSTFGIAVVDMYLDAIDICWKIYNIFQEFELVPDLSKPTEED